MKDVLKSALQLCGFFLILPLLLAAVTAFKGQILTLALLKQMALFKGAIGFVVIYLFIYNFKSFFEALLNTMSKLFAFTGGLAPAVGYIIPVFVFLTIMVNLVLIILEKASGLEGIFLVLVGFFLAFHWVLTAKHLFESDTSLLKSNYFLVFSLLAISHLVVGTFLLNWMISEFSSWSFLTNSYNLAKENYYGIYKFLFIDSR